MWNANRYSDDSWYQTVNPKKSKAKNKDSKFNRVTGRLFILSAPSGAGKTTLRHAILDRFPEMIYSVSYTTRKPRPGEKNGKDYYFIKNEEFKKKIEKDQWAEWAKVHGNYYGTPAEFLDKGLALGFDILLEIDVQGAILILERYPESITIFIMPPSLKILMKRLEERGADSKEVIENRLLNAEKEIAQKNIYRHIIINDQLPKAIRELVSVIEQYRDHQRLLGCPFVP